VKPGGIPGCLKVGIIIGVILIVGLVVLAFVLGQLVNGVLRSAGVNPDDIGNNPNGIGADCPFLSDQAARELVGGSADASDFSGLMEATLGLVIDRRALPGRPGLRDHRRREDLPRPDRQERRQRAGGLREGEGQRPADVAGPGRRRVGREPGYFGGDVSGVGDEAFCTGVSNAIMAGVVVRKGDTVVAVSVGPPSQGDQSVPDMENVGGVTTAPGLCQLAGTSRARPP
jgi:hypothetical protein